ncbi:MAG TPA: quinate 5-dehydrogenase [Firmicutes bacterium]|nr:quinate 5-dehydrogenase [Bacillota bacterium]
MKEVVSVSIGSSKRNHEVTVEVMGEDFLLKRIGTDGDINKAIEIINDIDGKVDAIGLGGIDFYIFSKSKRYTIRDSKQFFEAAKKTPIVDGSGLKNTLERRVIRQLHNQGLVDFANSNVMVVCGMDRFGMADEIEKFTENVIIGDLMFILGLGIPLHSLDSLNRVAKVLAPIAIRLPFSVLYPTGEKQNEVVEKFGKHYQWADIIAGDFLLIKQHMPKNLLGKTIITNTTTKDDVEDLRKRGVELLVTTTPELNGRSFGTNVMESMLVALSGKNQELTEDEYMELLDQLNFQPRCLWLQK